MSHFKNLISNNYVWNNPHNLILKGFKDALKEGVKDAAIGGLAGAAIGGIGGVAYKEFEVYQY